MKTQWNLKPFSLDLGHLWDITSGIQLEKDHTAKLTQAWDQFFHKSKTNQIGFFNWPLPENSSQIEEIEGLARKLRQRFQAAICMGIGGSYLGPIALQEILNPLPSNQDFKVQWISNADSAPISRAKNSIHTKKCLAVVISKSGGTTETLAAWFHLSHHFSKDSIVVITDPKQGELRRLSQAEGWHSLPVPPTVGEIQRPNSSRAFSARSSRDSCERTHRRGKLHERVAHGLPNFRKSSAVVRLLKISLG